MLIKVFFFTPLHEGDKFIFARDLTQCTITPVGWPFAELPVAAQCLQGAKYWKILEKKKTTIYRTPNTYTSA